MTDILLGYHLLSIAIARLFSVENSGQQTPAQEAPVMDTMPEEGAGKFAFK